MAIEITEKVRTIDSDVSNVYVKVTSYKVDVLKKKAFAHIMCFKSKEDSDALAPSVIVNGIPSAYEIDLSLTQVNAANHRKVIYDSLTELINGLGYVNTRID